MKWLTVLLLAGLVAGCSHPGAPPAGAPPASERPAAAESPAGRDTAPATRVPAPAAPEPRPGCEQGEVLRRPPEPEGSVSPVIARVFVREDPGIAAPMVAAIAELPITVAVQFDAPVDPATFSLAA